MDGEQTIRLVFFFGILAIVAVGESPADIFQ